MNTIIVQTEAKYEVQSKAISKTLGGKINSFSD